MGLLISSLVRHHAHFSRPRKYCWMSKWNDGMHRWRDDLLWNQQSGGFQSTTGFQISFQTNLSLRYNPGRPQHLSINSASETGCQAETKLVHLLSIKHWSGISLLSCHRGRTRCPKLCNQVSLWVWLPALLSLAGWPRARYLVSLFLSFLVHPTGIIVTHNLRSLLRILKIRSVWCILSCTWLWVFMGPFYTNGNPAHTRSHLRCVCCALFTRF